MLCTITSSPIQMPISFKTKALYVTYEHGCWSAGYLQTHPERWRGYFSTTLTTTLMCTPVYIMHMCVDTWGLSTSQLHELRVKTQRGESGYRQSGGLRSPGTVSWYNHLLPSITCLACSNTHNLEVSKLKRLLYPSRILIKLTAVTHPLLQDMSLWLESELDQREGNSEMCNWKWQESQRCRHRNFNHFKDKLLVPLSH